MLLGIFIKSGGQIIISGCFVKTQSLTPEQGTLLLRLRKRMGGRGEERTGGEERTIGEEAMREEERDCKERLVMMKRGCELDSGAAAFAASIPAT